MIHQTIAAARARLEFSSPEAPPSANGKDPGPETEQGGGVFLPISTILSGLERAEAGDAELFAQLYADKVAYDHAEGKWFFFTGHHWTGDQTGAITLLVSNELAAQYLFASAAKRHAGETDVSDRLKERANKLRYRNKVNNVLALAASQPPLALVGTEWDADPFLFGVANGVLNLRARDFEFRAGAPRDYIRTYAPTEWHGLHEPAPRFEQFLSEIFAGDTYQIGFVQRLYGSGISGLVTEHILPIAHGEGRNGKDTLYETFASVLGEYAAPVTTDILLEHKHNRDAPTPSIYALRHRRLVWASETNENARLNAGQVKWLTGGGTITARTLHAKPITFTPRYLLTLVTNHRPHASADDYALWKRILLIPFTEAFVEEPRQPNEHQRDPHLKEILKSEGPGILAWLVRGCLDWQADGLNPPPAVRLATQNYRDDEDTISQFIAERCILSPEASCRGGELHAAYMEWARIYNVAPLSATKFGVKMGSRFKKDTTTHVIYYGIGLLSKQTS